MSRYDIVLLDADGTLFDFDRSEREALRETFSVLELPFSEEIYADYHATNQGYWKRLERGEVSVSELKLCRFRDLFIHHGLWRDPEWTQEIYEGYLSRMIFEFEDALPACRQLKTIARLFIVTNGMTCVQTGKFALSSIPDLMENIFISEQLGAQKPNRKYFDRVFASIDSFCLEKTLIVGDSLTSDIQGGLNAGIDTCWVNRTGASAVGLNLRPTFEISTLRQLPPIVTKGSIDNFVKPF